MDFLWPDLLLLLGLIPLILAIYIWVLRRRCRFAVRYSSLSLVREAIPYSVPLRRHLPFILFIAALASLVIALGRPEIPEAVLSGQTTIILALDTSRSMCMRDILPSRLDAARAAALSFIELPVIDTQVGIVAFSGFAELAQEPTTELRLLENAIANLTTATQTAIGRAILSSLDAIAEVDERVAPSQEISKLDTSSPEQLPQLRVSEEDYVPHVIVLLTDGANNTGPSPLQAAQQAAERGVRIYSIGFGTTRNVAMDCWNVLSTDPFSSPGSESQAGGASFGNGPDEATLKQIAEMTGGKFYSAASADELHMVFQNLHSFLAMTNKKIEISAFFTAIAALLGILAMILSFLWHPLS
jgi:Ca-activated chloride channel homolog